MLHDQESYDSMVEAFAGLNVFTIGVTCPLPELEERERQRGDRVLGRARGLLDVVHTFSHYDVMVNTGNEDAQACVARVLDTLSR